MILGGLLYIKAQKGGVLKKRHSGKELSFESFKFFREVNQSKEIEIIVTICIVRLSSKGYFSKNENYRGFFEVT